jgi:hypothetical protein
MSKIVPSQSLSMPVPIPESNREGAASDENIEILERRKWNVVESEVPELVKEYEGHILVDLDETLYLRNSTEEFIGLACPGIIAAYVLAALELVRPWRWAGGPKCRDNWRIAVVLLLFPWTYLLWIRHCSSHVPNSVNRSLSDALRPHGARVIVASNGYKLLIKPMLKFFDLPDAGLVCCHIKNFGHRRDGKLALVGTRYGKELIAKSMVITDSYTDAALLRVCATPVLTVWSEAKFAKAFNGLAYLPGDYVRNIKRPRTGALRNIFLYDTLPWILVGASMTPSFTELFGLALLFFSMWSIYEIGYFDNDQCAIKYEDDPKLSQEAERFDGRFFEIKVWSVALLLGAAGIWLLQPADFLLFFSIWITVLLVLYGIYKIYNRIDKASRVWVYPLLQWMRFGSLFAIVAGSPVAFAAVLAQAVARSVDYFIYRYIRTFGIKKWPQNPHRTIRFCLFVFFLIPVILTGNWQVFLTPASLCLLLFAYPMMKFELPGLIKAVHRIDTNR